MDELRYGERAPRNRTITLSDKERGKYSEGICRLSKRVDVAKLTNTTINQDLFLILDYLPPRFVDLLFIDPPYNLTKDFGATSFKEMTAEEYTSWFL